MQQAQNGTDHGHAPRILAGSQHAGPSVPPAWRDYYQRLLERSPRFAGPRRFLREDITRAMKRVIHRDDSVLEVGTGAGHLIAALPNAERWGIDILPDAVEAARRTDPTIQMHLGDALSFKLPRKFDAIICDRLCHSVPDIQRLLENLAAHLEPNGRIFLTAFNFLWSLPIKLGSRIGFVEPSPEQNWLSESDFVNLFTLTDLEQVHTEDRILFPAPLPLLGPLLNNVAPKLPFLQLFANYRLHTLRKRVVARPAPKVTVVIPARNEAGNVQAAVDRTPVMGTATEVIFVEGGSTDGTRERIEQVMAAYKGPLELKLYGQTGKGKGDAVRTGFAHATGDLLMILDADLTVVPEDLPKFYEVMVRGMTDYVHGTRLVYPMEDEAMRFLNKLGNAFFAKTFSFLLGQPIKDSLCGTKVLWRHDYERIARNRQYFGDFDPFGDFDLIFGARKLNLKIMEIPVRYRSRTYGETNISRFSHGFLLLRMSIFAGRKIKFA